MIDQPLPNHPETVDPPWFCELVRRAFDREMRRLQTAGCDPEEAMDRAMWFVFNIRHNLTELYRAGNDQGIGHKHDDGDACV